MIYTEETLKSIIRCTTCQQRLRVPINIGQIRVTCSKCKSCFIVDTGNKPHYHHVQLPYQVIDIQQGSTAWLAWRDSGLGSSDAPTIMGENPWKSRKQLLYEKKNKIRIKANAAMARGTSLEPEARKKYEEMKKISVHPICLKSSKFDWLLASVDGLSKDGRFVVEIKCGNSVYRNTRSTNKVPKYYYGQLQHILAVTDLPMIDFWCYLPDLPGININVYKDDRYIAELLENEMEFWNDLKKLGN
ncbi:lambda-exonuclease family protein [Desulfatitalea tepidiphila]|uniref:lambda-exonuclease family protein n=1 Tax=Desulfatitalea tepidiphila TaxID=1185843 RepID=UPI000976D98D|nr:YqaJ viral recombinase family protein [Desulfatitalea tepidiphila]